MADEKKEYQAEYADLVSTAKMIPPKEELELYEAGETLRPNEGQPCKDDELPRHRQVEPREDRATETHAVDGEMQESKLTIDSKRLPVCVQDFVAQVCDGKKRIVRDLEGVDLIRSISILCKQTKSDPTRSTEKDPQRSTTWRPLTMMLIVLSLIIIGCAMISIILRVRAANSSCVVTITNNTNQFTVTAAGRCDTNVTVISRQRIVSIASTSYRLKVSIFQTNSTIVMGKDMCVWISSGHSWTNVWTYTAGVWTNTTDVWASSLSPSLPDDPPTIHLSMYAWLAYNLVVNIYTETYQPDSGSHENSLTLKV